MPTTYWLGLLGALADPRYSSGDEETRDRLAAAVAQCDFRGFRVRQPLGRVVGVSLGGCVEAVGTSRAGAMRRSAHAHTSARDPRRGWVCVKSPNPSRLVSATGRPTRLLWHEWAHIYANAGHTERWRALLRGVGQVAESRSADHLRPTGGKYRTVEEWDRLSGVRSAAPGKPYDPCPRHPDCDRMHGCGEEGTNE